MPEFAFVSARLGSEAKKPQRHEPALLLETRNFWLIATMPVTFTLTPGPTLPVVMSVMVASMFMPPPAPELDELVFELLAFEPVLDELAFKLELALEVTFMLEPPAP